MRSSLLGLHVKWIFLSAMLLLSCSDQESNIDSGAQAPEEKGPFSTFGVMECGGRWMGLLRARASDGLQTVILRIAADSLIDGWWDETSRPAILFQSSVEDTMFCIQTGCPIREVYGLDSALVAISIDAHPPEDHIWHTARDGQTLFSPKPLEMIRSVLDAEQVRVRFPVFGSGSDSVRIPVFSVGGLYSEFKDRLLGSR